MHELVPEPSPTLPLHISVPTNREEALAGLPSGLGLRLAPGGSALHLNSPWPQNGSTKPPGWVEGGGLVSGEGGASSPEGEHWPHFQQDWHSRLG